MKISDVLPLLGLKRRAQSHSYHIDKFDLGGGDVGQFAQWEHPKVQPLVITRAMVDAIRSWLPEGSVVIDIGAHSGDTSVLYAMAAGLSGRVFAVEPNPYVLPVLRANAGLNPWAARIEVLPYAATYTAGPLTFNYSDPGFCNGGDLSDMNLLRRGHHYSVEVQGRNVAELLRENWPEQIARIELIKTDTEGHDHAVLETMRDIIVEARPMIRSEVYKRLPVVERCAFWQFLTDLGYAVYKCNVFDYDTNTPLTKSDMMNWRQFDIMALPM